jgi:hypothetical protein
MSFSLSEAAKAVGKAKSTILRAVQSGRLKATLEYGQYVIDEHALFSLYAPVRTSANATRNAPDAPPEELAKLRAENALLREWLNDLRGRLDQSEDERRRLNLATAKLIEEREKPHDTLLKKLFGKRGA